jgi:hypothetical protein
MTDDLVKRLRDNDAISTALSRIYDDEELRYEAAERIEQLEKGFFDIFSQQPLDLDEAAERIEQLEKGFFDILSQQPLDLVVAMISKSCLAGAIDKNGKYCFVGNLKIVDGKSSMGDKDD